MELTKPGRVRRLVITGAIGAALGGGVAGVALASTGSATPTTTRTATTSSTSSSSPSPSTGSSSAPRSGMPGHHCTHMGSSGGTSSS
jgi:hypothetical protein